MQIKKNWIHCVLQLFINPFPYFDNTDGKFIIAYKNPS